MPYYDYVCKNCLAEFEIEHAMKDSVTLCAQCGEHTLRKQITIAPVIYKTGGFYCTDNRKPNGRGTA